MSAPKFKVGDRVITTVAHSHGVIPLGSKGVVLENSLAPYIQFDTPVIRPLHFKGYTNVRAFHQSKLKLLVRSTDLVDAEPNS